MRTITVDEIEKALDEIDNTHPSEIENLISTMSDQQAYLLTYLLAVGKENFDEEENEGFFYLGFTIWYTMQKVNSDIPSIGEEEIESAENNNFKMLDVMADETEEGITHLIEMIVENYNQPGLFGYIVESLMEEEDDEGEQLFQPDNSGMMLIYLKTVIDCLDKY